MIVNGLEAARVDRDYNKVRGIFLRDLSISTSIFSHYLLTIYIR